MGCRTLICAYYTNNMITCKTNNSFVIWKIKLGFRSPHSLNTIITLYLNILKLKYSSIRTFYIMALQVNAVHASFFTPLPKYCIARVWNL